MWSAGGSREGREGLGYLRQQLIVIDFPWIRKRRGIHDDPRGKKERTAFESSLASHNSKGVSHIGRVLR